MGITIKRSFNKYQVLFTLALFLLCVTAFRMEARAAVPEVSGKTGSAVWEQSGTAAYTFDYDIDANTAVITGLTYSGTNKAAAVTIPAQMQVKYAGKTYKVDAAGIGDGTASCIRNTGTGRVTSLTLPLSIKRIAANAFKDNTELAACYTGNGVETIGDSAFAGCTALKTFTLGESVSSVGEGILKDCPLSGQLAVNCIRLMDSKGAFQDHTGINKLTLGSKVTVIADRLFSGCTGITASSLTIGNAVVYLGERAFDSCKQVTKVTLGTGLLEMGKDVFQDSPLRALVFNCVNLSDVKGNFRSKEGSLSAANGGSITIGTGVTAVPDELKALMTLKGLEGAGSPGKAVTFKAPYTGQYLLQAWGASGGGGTAGGYAYGYYDMEKGEELYIYTGTAGAVSTAGKKAAGGFNGGGDGSLGAGSGGGATDFRTVKAGGTSGWNNQAKGKETPENLKTDESLLSRILTAGGGGGIAANGSGAKDAKGRTADTVTGGSSFFGVGGGAVGGSSQGVSKPADQAGGYARGMGEDSCTVRAPSGHPGENASATYGGAGGGGYYGGGQSSSGRYSSTKNPDGTALITEVGGSGGGGSGYIGGVYGVDKKYYDDFGKVVNYEDIGSFTGVPCYSNTFSSTGKEILDDADKVVYGPDRRALRAAGEKQASGAASITYLGTVSSRVTLQIEEKAGSFSGKQSLTLSNYAFYTTRLPEPEMKEGYEFMYYELYSGDGVVNEDGTYSHRFQDSVLRAVYSGELKLSQKPNTAAFEGKGAVDLSWSEEDDILKLFYVQQSTDRKTWVNLGEGGQGAEEVEEGFIRDKRNSHGSAPSVSCIRTYTVPYSGVYYLTLAGGSGGVAHGARLNGYGGLVKGKLSLKKGDIVQVEVGGRGGHGNGGAEEGSFRGQGGFRGGGGGEAWNEEDSYFGRGGGGGAGRVLVNGVTVMIAGGGGGGNTDGGGSGGGGNRTVIAKDNKLDQKTVAGGKTGSRDDGQGGGGSGYTGGDAGYGGSSFFNEGGTVAARLLSSKGSAANTLLLPEAFRGRYTINDGRALLESGVIFPELSDNFFTAKTPDTAPPDAPAGGKSEKSGEGIRISWSVPEDNGSIYYHRVGSCYDGGLKELRMSEVLESPEICSGVAGYYYYIDRYPVGIAGKGNSSYVTENGVNAPMMDHKGYLHVAAVDRAGNIGSTYNFQIDVPLGYTVTFHGNRNWNTDQGSYQQEIEYNQETELKACLFTRKAPYTQGGVTYREGYRFLGWSSSAGSTEVKYTDRQRVKNIAQPEGNIDLFAVWSKEITLTFDLKGGSYNGAEGNIVLKHTIKNDHYDTFFNLRSEFDAYGTYSDNGINEVIRKQVMEEGHRVTYRLLGWTLDSAATAETLKTPQDMVVYSPDKVLLYTCRDSVTLYAVWEPIVSLLARGDRVFGGKGSLAAATATVLYKNTGVMPSFKDGQKGKYTLETYGRGDSMEVTFDSKFTWIYEEGDEGVKDTLNPVTGESTGTKHGLNRRIALDGTKHFQSVARYFHVPNYLGTGRAPGSVSSGDQYLVTLTVTNRESYYWNNYKGMEEKATVYLKLPLGGEGDVHPTVRTHVH